MGLADRMLTRALPGIGAGFGNTIKPKTSGKAGSAKPVAATQPVNWSNPGQPTMADWDPSSSLENGYFAHAYVMRCCQVIADTIAGLPFRVGPDIGNPASTDPNAPLAKLLGSSTPANPGGPNPTTSARTFWAWSIVQYLVTGRFAWEYQVDKNTLINSMPQVVGLWPLASQCLDVIYSQGGSTRWFDGFQYRTGQGTVINMGPDSIFYGWKRSQRDWRQAESALEAARLPLAVAIGFDRYQWNLLKNNMVGTTMVTAPPFAEGGQRRAWEEQFLAEFTGYDRAGSTIFNYIDGPANQHTPNVQVEKLSQSSTDAQMLAIAEQAKIDITIALGVPLSLIGNASQRTYSNADMEYRNFWTTRVLPLVMELQDMINTSLAPRVGSEMGWFDLTRVVALQPPSPFAPPNLTDLITAGVVTPESAGNILGLSTNPDIDTATAPIGEESANPSITAGGAKADRPYEQRFSSDEPRDPHSGKWIGVTGGVKDMAQALGLHHRKAAQHPNFDKSARKNEKDLQSFHARGGGDSLLHQNFTHEIIAAHDAQKKGQTGAVASHLGAATAIEADLRSRGVQPQFGNLTMRSEDRVVPDGVITVDDLLGTVNEVRARRAVPVKIPPDPADWSDEHDKWLESVSTTDDAD